MRVGELITGLTAEQLRTPPAPGEWSANDVLAHLRACSDVWGGYIRRILAEDNPAFRAISPRTFIKKTDYPSQDFFSSFQAYADQRADLLSTLEPLSPSGWERSAMVTKSGKQQKRTVHSYVQSLATHERAHLTQIEAIVEAVRGR